MLDGKVVFCVLSLFTYIASGGTRSVPRSELEIRCLLYVCKFTSSLTLYSVYIFLRPLDIRLLLRPPTNCSQVFQGIDK